MIQNTQILSTENETKSTPSVVNSNVSASDSIIYFDIVADDLGSKSVEPRQIKKRHERFFAQSIRSKKPHSATSQPSFRQPAPRSLIVKRESKQLFDILLGYLDRIVRLDEISENLEKLNVAFESGNTIEINLIAYVCVDLCADFGMAAAIEPLLELERVEHENQMPKAAVLVRRVKQEFERYNFALKRSLDSLTATNKFGGRVSSI